MTSKIFVYGTLVGQQRNAEKAVLKNATKITDGNFPTIKPEEGSQVEGEIMEVNESELQNLDRYESEGHLYHRIPLNRNRSIQTYVSMPEKLGSDEEFDVNFTKAALEEAFKKTELDVMR